MCIGTFHVLWHSQRIRNNNNGVGRVLTSTPTCHCRGDCTRDNIIFTRYDVIINRRQCSNWQNKKYRRTPLTREKIAFWRRFFFFLSPAPRHKPMLLRFFDLIFCISTLIHTGDFEKENFSFGTQCCIILLNGFRRVDVLFSMYKQCTFRYKFYRIMWTACTKWYCHIGALKIMNFDICALIVCNT